MLNATQDKFLNELRYKVKALTMTTPRGKSHNTLGKQNITIAKAIQENICCYITFLKRLQTKQKPCSDRKDFYPRQSTKEVL